MESKAYYKISQLNYVIQMFQILLFSVIITRTLSLYFNAYLSVDLGNTSYCGDNNDTIHSKANSSFLECLVQCWIRPGCNGVNYKRRFSYCSLFNETTFTRQPGCLHIPRQQIHVHPNNTVACNGTQTYICNLLNSSQETKECQQIANVYFGQVLGNIYNIGSRLYVTCDQGYTLTGNYSSIGCMTDGQWSDTPTCMATGMSSTAPPSPTTTTIQQSSQTTTPAPPTTTQTSTTSTLQSPTTTPSLPTTTTQQSTTSTPTQTTNPPPSTSSTTTGTTTTQPLSTTHPPPTTTPIQTTSPPPTVTITSTTTTTTHPPPTTAPIQTTSPPSSTHSTVTTPTTTRAPTTTTIAMSPTTTTSAQTSCVDSCIGLTDGNYQACNTCTGYIACNGGHLYNMQCPGGVVWDDNLKVCTFTSATCP